MKLIGIREGFGTNSSSAHSIILKGTSLEDNYNNNYYGFGWDEFICSSKQSKIEYFISMLVSNFRYDADKEEINNAIVYVFNRDIDTTDRYIDHQSCIGIPRNINGNLDLEFYKKLIQPIIENNSIAIIGGNNNNEDPSFDFSNHNIYNYELYSMLKDHSGYNIRKESFGWVLFNTHSGKKYYISDDLNDIDCINDLRLTNYRPELIDMKITDFCAKECKFCYQNSTKSGKHSDSYNITYIIEVLKKLEVFEVCIGGGEALNHPDLFNILKTIKNANIIPNLTIADYNIFKYPSVIRKLFTYVKAIGLSVNNLKEFRKIYYDNKEVFNNFNNRIYIHTILGLTNIDKIYDIIEFASSKNINNILLLGLKQVGRATNCKEVEYTTNFIKKIQKKFKYIRLGIDTVVVNKYQHFLDECKIDRRLYFTNEGTHSKYIDAVNYTVGINSYSEKLESFKHYKHDYVDNKKLTELLLKN